MSSGEGKGNRVREAGAAALFRIRIVGHILHLRFVQRMGMAVQAPTSSSKIRKIFAWPVAGHLAVPPRRTFRVPLSPLSLITFSITNPPRVRATTVEWCRMTMYDPPSSPLGERRVIWRVSSLPRHCGACSETLRQMRVWHALAAVARERDEGRATERAGRQYAFSDDTEERT